MGAKSRGNFAVEVCMKFKCIHRDIRCQECRQSREYDDGQTTTEVSEMQETVSRV